jgi:cell division septation protein DedD
MLGLATLLALPAGGVGQAPSLDRVETLIAEAAYDNARTTLAAWWDARESASVPGAERARALMLRARLADDHAAAERDYLSIVLGHPTSSHAPLALLRLGQGLLAAGEPVRAAGYLQRLVADYPGRQERTVGLLWLARAQTANRQDAAACATARRALNDTEDVDLRTMLQAEESVACAAAGARVAGRTPADDPVRSPPPAPAPAPPAAPPTAPPAQRADAAPPTAAAERRATDGPPAVAGRFTAQTGAFRQQATLDEMVTRLRRAGYEPRAVRVPANDLIRVRVGSFASREEAARLVARLRSDGFDALVASDADRERTP